jgi:hypothetical protein
LGMIVGRAMPRNAHSVAVLTVRCVLEVCMRTNDAQTRLAGYRGWHVHLCIVH